MPKTLEDEAIAISCEHAILLKGAAVTPPPVRSGSIRLDVCERGPAALQAPASGVSLGKFVRAAGPSEWRFWQCGSRHCATLLPPLPLPPPQLSESPPM